MTHAGEERAFGLIGGIGRIARLAEHGLAFAQLVGGEAVLDVILDRLGERGQAPPRFVVEGARLAAVNAQRTDAVAIGILQRMAGTVAKASGLGQQRTFVEIGIFDQTAAQQNDFGQRAF